MPEPVSISNQPTLRVHVGDSPLAAEHRRILRSTLRRGDNDPEGALQQGSLEGSYALQTIKMAENAWRARMVHEHHSAAVFSRLLPQLMEAEAPLEYKTSVLRMSMDELRHASLCASVVSFLGGDPEVPTNLATQPLPEHPKVSRVEASLRNVLFVGCLCETVSLTLLTEEREMTEEPAIRSVVAQLASDEVLHAKLGWSYLNTVWPTLDRAARERTRDYLPVALKALERDMLGAMPLSASVSDETREDLERLGCMHSETGRELLQMTLEEVILPRLREAGVLRAGD